MANLLVLNLLLPRFVFASRSKSLFFFQAIRFWRGADGHHSNQLNTSGKLQGFLCYCRLPWHIFFLSWCHVMQTGTATMLAPAQPNLAWFKAFVAATHQNMAFLGEKSPSSHHDPCFLPAFIRSSMQLDGALQPPQERTAVSVADLFCPSSTHPIDILSSQPQTSRLPPFVQLWIQLAAILQRLHQHSFTHSRYLVQDFWPHFWLAKMNSANVEKLEVAEKSTSLLLPTYNDNRPTKAEVQNNMFKIQHFFLTLFLVTLLTLSLVSAVSNNARQPAALAVSEEQAKFQDLLNSVEPGCLHEVLHEFMGSKYKHGVYQEDKTAMEVLHQSNAEVAHSLIELAKRQGGTSSSNGSATTTTVSDATTATSVPVTSTTPPTTLPPSSSTTVPVPPISSTPQTTPQSTSSTTTVIKTSTASPSGSTTAPTSTPSSTIGTFQGGPAAYPFAPPPLFVSSSSYGPVQNTSYLPYSFAPPLPAPSTAAYTVQNSSVSVSTTPPSYGAAVSASSVQNSSVSEIVPLSPYGIPLTAMAQNSSSYSPAALSWSSAYLPQNITSAFPGPSYGPSSAYSVQTSSCSSTAATLYTPTLTMYNTSSSTNCSATMSSTVPPSSFPTLTPAQNCSNSSIPSISNATLPVSGFNNYSGVASTSGPPPSSHGSSSSTLSPTSSSGHPGYTSFSSSVQFSPLGQPSNTSLGSTSSTRSPGSESLLTTSRSITQQVVYTTTGENGAQETVTRTTIVPADQAETGGTGGTGTSTATASLQSNGVSSDKNIGLNLVLGALGLIVAGAL
jgi:hypothetical protein